VSDGTAIVFKTFHFLPSTFTTKLFFLFLAIRLYNYLFYNNKFPSEIQLFFSEKHLIKPFTFIKSIILVEYFFISV
jgi:hypothetical protein